MKIIILYLTKLKLGSVESAKDKRNLGQAKRKNEVAIAP